MKREKGGERDNFTIDTSDKHHLSQTIKGDIKTDKLINYVPLT